MEKDPKEEQHVEELLSQLQGIFGKLSKSEEEEARSKADVPRQSPPPPAAPPSAPQPPVEHPPIPDLSTPLDAADPFALQPRQSLPATPEFVTAPPAPVPPSPVTLPQSAPPPSTPDPVPPSAPFEPMPAPPAATPVVVSTPPVLPEYPAPAPLDPAMIGCAIYYPPMREKEAKALAQKIETMTPKFTKVAFKLKVIHVVTYDARSEWRQAAVQSIQQSGGRAVFLISERPIEEAKRRAAQSEFEARQIYFQEVPVAALEKKAFFTDVLLGMVFFFDTLKSKTPGE